MRAPTRTSCVPSTLARRSRRRSPSCSRRPSAPSASTSAEACRRCASTSASGSSAGRSSWPAKSGGATGPSARSSKGLECVDGGPATGWRVGGARSRTCSSTRRCPARSGRRGRSSCAATRSWPCPASSSIRRSKLSATELERAVTEVMIEEDNLQRRIAELGTEISADYEGRDLLLVGVLKGAVFFLADLMRHLTVPCEIDFMAISSYGASTDSSGVVRILKDLDIEGRHVLVVADIIDSGLTLSYLMRNLEAREPASLEVCALLTKPARREIDVPVRYVGFEIPNRFVIGYGLDFAERYRNLPYVGVLRPDLIPDGA